MLFFKPCRGQNRSLHRATMMLFYQDCRAYDNSNAIAQSLQGTGHQQYSSSKPAGDRTEGCRAQGSCNALLASLQGKGQKSGRAQSNSHAQLQGQPGQDEQRHGSWLCLHNRRSKICKNPQGETDPADRLTAGRPARSKPGILLAMTAQWRLGCVQYDRHGACLQTDPCHN